MKKLLSIFLLVAIAFNVFGKAIIWANYEVNKAEITRKYCENKAKPKLRCDGKCHLKKQMEKEEKKEKNEGSKESKEKIESQYFVEINYSFGTQHSTLKTQHSYSPNHSHSHSHSVFSPPQC
ncbi:MAG: hypothetical protein ACO3EE_04225 [Flavobacteriales bacterium]